MDNVNFSSEALLSNQGDMTSFRYGNSNIRFRTPKCLKRYTEVKEWDNGYIVVMADYEGMGETEEYIDLLPILKNLYINPETFLKPIKTVKIDYHEGRRNLSRSRKSHDDSLRICIFANRRRFYTCSVSTLPISCSCNDKRG